MPHKCVRCSKMYETGALALREGCSCGSKVFLFLSDKDIEAHTGDIKWIERELANVVDRIEGPITLEVENVNIPTKGVFELDVNSLVKNPVVVKDEDGVYYIRLGSKTHAHKKKKKK